MALRKILPRGKGAARRLNSIFESRRQWPRIVEHIIHEGCLIRIPSAQFCAELSRRVECLGAQDHVAPGDQSEAILRNRKPRARAILALEEEQSGIMGIPALSYRFEQNGVVRKIVVGDDEDNEVGSETLFEILEKG